MPSAIGITNARRRVIYHEAKCDALAGGPGEDAAIANYSQALEDMALAEYVHEQKVVEVEDEAAEGLTRAREFDRDAVADRSTEWLMQQHQALAHDPDAQEAIAERLTEREGDGEELPRQGRYAVRRATDRIAQEMVAQGLYGNEHEARRAIAAWFGQKPDENLSEAQLAGVTEADARRDYEDRLAFDYARANEQTKGELLSRRGKAAGVSAESLFRGPLSQVEPFASEELRSYWARNGRMTWSAYRYEVLGRDSDRAAHTRSRTNLPDDVALV